mmetsp:Transcript_2890/g.10462  ORF Transcript_2890/g.10462 Transcript_2890/m.10462 type:complete len:202 (-) Transcript_2890:315-920(-)
MAPSTATPSHSSALLVVTKRLNIGEKMVDSRLRESLSLKSSSSWRTTASSSSPVAATGDGVGGAGTPTRSGVLLPEPLHVFRRSEEPERFVRLRPTDVISRWPASASVSVSRSALLSPAALCRLRSGDGLPACPGCEGTGDCGWSDMLLGAEACRDRGPRNSELNAEESAPLRLNRRDADARSFLSGESAPSFVLPWGVVP